jgi:RHS repeat-associated protein
LNGNRIKSIDIFGNITNYEYDEFNRLVKTTYPNVLRYDGSQSESIEELYYDGLNHLTSKIDSNGHTIQVSYTARDKPCSIIHPDGSEELHIYSIQGQLVKSILPNKTYIFYEYDYKNRVIAKKNYSSEGTLISEQYWFYNAFQLLKEIDCNGTISEYFYDYSGKLIKGLKGESETLFIYDALGRQKEICEKFSECNYRRTINKYDQLNRVVEERIEDNHGNLFSQKNYQYDAKGNITNTFIKSLDGVIRKTIEYDNNNLPKRIFHPNGEITHFYRDYHYRNSQGNTVRYEEETDPLGNTIARTFDERGKIAIEEFRTSIGSVSRKISNKYDGVGNLISRTEHNLGENDTNIETFFEYNARNLETAIIEAVGTPEEKITRKEFNSIGKISKIKKPDGSEICYQYDAIGRLTDEVDSTGYFHYNYSYDGNNNILSVLNVISNSLTTREYDVQNNVTKEILENGFELNYEYDFLGRCQKIVLPDGSNISCQYDARNLIKLTRETSKTRYQFQYDYDVSGKIKKILLPFGNDKVGYVYDDALRLIDIHSPYFSQHIPKTGYDACNRLVKYENADTLGNLNYEYAYDSLNQLICEDGIAHHTYKYDARFNRIKEDEINYENNALNQLLSQGQKRYAYDLNGNRKSTSSDQLYIECKFDTLDRLIEVIDNDKKIKFEYDAFHRRMSKQVLLKTEQCWNEVHYEKYIYVTDFEIGSTDQYGNIKQLKVIGPGQLKNSAALELIDKVYIPIHDHRGSVMTLVNADDGTVTETYRYSAFGEEQIFNSNGVEVNCSINPWRFSGKRVDEETGWSYFGRRYYDPEVGRWIGPDPIWFEDGTNLYSYVQNSPIVFIDPNGLSQLNCTNISAYIPSYETIAEFIVNCVLYVGKALCLQRHHWESYRSKEIIIEGKQYPGIHISCGFGVFVTEDEARKHAEKISNDWGGAEVKLYHNASHGPLDCIEYLLNIAGFNTDPVRNLSTGLKEDIDKADPNDVFYHYSHSQGCVIARNALRDMGPDYCKRVGAIALCPGGYIDEDICMSVDHFASNMDLVPWLDFPGRFRNSHTTKILSRHPEAKWFDHEFTSPTFGETLKNIAETIMEKHGINYENL